MGRRPTGSKQPIRSREFGLSRCRQSPTYFILAGRGATFFQAFTPVPKTSVAIPSVDLVRKLSKIPCFGSHDFASNCSNDPKCILRTMNCLSALVATHYLGTNPHPETVPNRPTNVTPASFLRIKRTSSVDQWQTCSTRRHARTLKCSANTNRNSLLKWINSRWATTLKKINKTKAHEFSAHVSQPRDLSSTPYTPPTNPRQDQQQTVPTKTTVRMYW